MKHKKIKALDWHGLYGEGWKNEITADAFAHPAKFSRGLIRKIYAHMIERGWLQPGETVIDPFGGVALGALEAMRLGCHWVGVELEAKFVTLGNANIALWNKRYARMPHWGDAILLRGDSRQLLAVLGRAGIEASVSSPPYAERTVHGDDSESARLARKGNANRNGRMANNERCLTDYSDDPRNLGNLKPGDVSAAIGSPPYSAIASGNGGLNTKPGKDGQQSGRNPHSPSQDSDNHYGDTPSQLSNLKPGALDAALSSPPYAESLERPNGIDPSKSTARKGGPHSQMYGDPRYSAAVSSPPYEGARIGQESGQESCGRGDQYGATAGQLGAMKPGEVDAAVSSPPYLPKDDRKVPWGATVGKTLADEDERRGYNLDESFRGTYSLNPANLGNPTGADQETFWTAARIIVEQTYLALKSGGVAAWVVKDFVRNKQIVPFCDQWRQLCEACGFETLEIARAWLVEDMGTTIDLDGNHKNHTKQRKSFFRRLAESKGSPRIDFEQVIFMVKR